VWVANSEGNSVTELNASNGSLVRVINATADGFNFPTSVAVSGTHVWVTNNLTNNNIGNSVTELNASNGSLVRVIYPGSEPYGVAVSGTHVWVANVTGDSVTELNASNGSLVRIIH
jgi:DNA-binding beta-propeller fold protein YncE